MTLKWHVAGSAKRQSILDAIPDKWRLEGPLPSARDCRDITGSFMHLYLTASEISITEMDIKDLAAAITTGRLSAEEVLNAFSHRAALAHQWTNCLREYFYDAALVDAKKLDEYFKTHGKPIGPLHGIPISLKDQCHVKGVETTMGYTGWIGKFQGKKDDPRYKTYESVIVTALRNAGAILFVKTSVPHKVLIGETVNNIIQYTWNPKNRTISAGDSSGGEGALIALKGAVVGIGTDIGGSIRIPTAFCGFYGLKPSHGRFPYEGMAISVDGQITIPSVLGPMAALVSGLDLVAKDFLSQEPWLHDPQVVALPWRPTHYEAMANIISKATAGQGNLAFGIVEHDGAVAPHPPIKRALRMVTAILESLGHRVIKWAPPSHEVGVRLALTSWIYDGGADIHYHMGLANEPIPEILSKNYGTKPLRQFNATEIAANNVALRECRKAYIDYWNSTTDLTGTSRPVDAVISPVAPFCAVRPSKYHYYGYSIWSNAADFTSGSFPVTLADMEIDVKDSAYQPLNDVDQIVYDDYDLEIYDKSFVGLQLVGRRFEEEKMVALLEYMAKLFKV
ncbi:hypothetical protein FOVG_17268 [Fusarium oxysporum f. sp. pisi HDV247]|uniref:Amidase domain-containing protein n=1 Tax=Fusarium oxysporum f. sp. pisi HDV247 TaxID=1080344 RepID=W9NUJ4_FUSOX|nr:hypothetical protein FOVG_17268 [Fusarium oxysporum f. sp. pisi HDV247]